jgi:hypothetical protein
MIAAPYPQTDSETVAEYNRRHIGKAWSIVGMSWQGDIYCTRETCAGVWPTYEHDMIEGPRPVFASDEYDRDYPCGNCHGDIF